MQNPGYYMRKWQEEGIESFTDEEIAEMRTRPIPPFRRILDEIDRTHEHLGSTAIQAPSDEVVSTE